MQRLFLLLVVIGVMIPFPVQAQTEPVLSAVDIWIWPEYDQPTALVILRMTVANQVSLPLRMTFRIPARASKPHAMAVGPSFEQVADREYTLEPDGDWLKVNVVVDGRAIQLEYYDPALTRQGMERSYRFIWPGDYAVQLLHVEVQQPLDATAMSIEPALPNMTPSENRLIYYSGDFGALAAGQTFELSFRYQKASDTLTISFLKPEPVAPLSPNTPGRISLTAYLPWLIGAMVFLIVIAGAVYGYYRSTSPAGCEDPAHWGVIPSSSSSPCTNSAAARTHCTL